MTMSKSSFVLLEESVCYDQCVLLAKLYKAKLACKSRYLLTAYLCIPFPMMKHIFGVLVVEDLVGLHRTILLQLLRHQQLGVDLDYYGIEWVSLEMNRDHSVIFEIVPKY